MSRQGDPRKNIGFPTKSVSKKIAEYVETGRIADHEKLRAKVPLGLLDVIRIPGLGPKTVRLLWEEGHVTDIETLKAAIDAGSVTSSAIGAMRSSSAMAICDGSCAAA